jgi:(p)ppGpp synthase/HD superfamily hydrolase
VSHPIKPVQTILSAVVFAAEKHANQRRKGAAAEPYINHLIEVAELVAGALSEPDTNLVIAALLHDVIEDAGVTIEELTQRFGADVAGLVAEVTDDKSLPKQERKRLQVVNAPKESERAQLIKLADKISNLRSLHFSPPVGWDSDRTREYVLWAREVIDRLAKPNPILQAEFDAVLEKLHPGLRPGPVR